nr:hypothetical protein [Tanacetum cinerariifolium]
MPPKRDLRLIDEHIESVYEDVISNIAPSDVKTVKTIDTAQAKKIADLKKRVKMLERKEKVKDFRDEFIQDWLAAGIDHRKARQGLAEVAAYNPSTKANYVTAVNALLGKASISGVPTAVTTTTFIQTSSVPLILLADDRVLGAKQPIEVPSPSRIVFEKENWRLRQSILRLVKSVVAFFLVTPSLHHGRM